MANMSPSHSVRMTLVQFFLSGLLRVVSLGYLFYDYIIVRNHYMSSQRTAVKTSSLPSAESGRTKSS